MMELWATVLLILESVFTVATQKIETYVFGDQLCLPHHFPAIWLPSALHSAISNGTVDPSQLVVRLSANKTTRIADPDVEMAAQFCVRHPCQETPFCIRKCCPAGMAINRTSKFCEKYPHQPMELRVTIKKREGTDLEIRGGLIPDCPLFTINASIPADYYGDDQLYSISSSGYLYVDYQPDMKTNDYCVDTFFHNSFNSSKITLLGCYTPNFVENVAQYIVPYFLILPSVCLIATFAVYAVLPELRNIHGVTVMCQVSSMAVMFVLKIVFLLNKNLDEANCLALAIMFHFASLSSFTWLNVISYDIWWTISDLKPSSLRLGRRFVFYSLFAWGVPFLIVLTGQILDSVKVPDYVINPGFGGWDVCWFADLRSLIAYLYGPFTVLAIVNVTFFILSAVRLHQASVDAALLTNDEDTRQQNRRFRTILSLFVSILFILGVSWMLDGIGLAFEEYASYFFIATDVLNVLSGVTIFGILVCKRTIWRLLKKRFARQSHLAPTSAMLDSRF